MPTMADCCLVPQIYNARRFELDMAPYPTLRAIEDACNALPAFQAAHPAQQPDAA
jgi:maleylpyruvate isomerase